MSENNSPTKIDNALCEFEQNRQECVDKLLDGIPDEGGCIDRETFENLIRAAFNGGVIAAIVKRN